MRIRLRRSGGFAGLQAPPVEIDSQQLPADKAHELEQLVTQARLFDQPAGSGPSRPSGPGPSASSGATQPAGSAPSPPPAGPGQARDAFQYDLSIDDGGRSQAVRLHEATMHPEAARLVQWLTREGRGASGQK